MGALVWVWLLVVVVSGNLHHASIHDAARDHSHHCALCVSLLELQVLLRQGRPGPTLLQAVRVRPDAGGVSWPSCRPCKQASLISIETSFRLNPPSWFSGIPADGLGWPFVSFPETASSSSRD